MSEINVNLGKCDCPSYARNATTCARSEHHPVNIPCRVPESMTFTVRLGKCTCPSWMQQEFICKPECPARPIRVTVFISGKTWPDSKVSTVERHDEQELADALVNACGEHWALMKALMLGRDPAEPEVPVTAAPGVLALFTRRDVVFARLAALARAEDTAFAEQEAIIKELGAPSFASTWLYRRDPTKRVSADLLARYVDELREVIGKGI